MYIRYRYMQSYLYNLHDALQDYMGYKLYSIRMLSIITYIINCM